MAATSGHCIRAKVFIGLWLLLLLVGGHPVRAESTGDALSGTEKRQGRLVALSIRIAQARGNDAKVRKYKSIARQQRGRKRVPATLVNFPGRRVSRPGRNP
jgi:hypothetical protein